MLPVNTVGHVAPLQRDVFVREGRKNALRHCSGETKNICAFLKFAFIGSVFGLFLCYVMSYVITLFQKSSEKAGFCF